LTRPTAPSNLLSRRIGRVKSSPVSFWLWGPLARVLFDLLQNHLINASEELSPSGFDPIQDLQVDRNAVEVPAVPEVRPQAVASLPECRRESNLTGRARIQLRPIEYTQDDITGADHLLVCFSDLRGYVFERCKTDMLIPNSARFLNRGTEWLFPWV
jgi:hypothetical protein